MKYCHKIVKRKQVAQSKNGEIRRNAYIQHLEHMETSYIQQRKSYTQPAEILPAPSRAPTSNAHNPYGHPTDNLQTTETQQITTL